MPIYEYVCSGCGHAFEALVYGREAAACPACAGSELEKQPSVFGTRSPGDRPELTPPGACGSCGDPRGPGSCSQS